MLHFLKEGTARKGPLKERCGLEPRTNIFSFKKLVKLVRIRFGCGLDSRIYGSSVVIVKRPRNGLPKNYNSNPGEAIVVSHHQNDPADTGVQTTYPNPSKRKLKSFAVRGKG